ncbi:type II secretion system GspH family protein [Clostridium sp. FP2]|uniref:PilW family protein n=1 Tax=Clostridium sp. FP2 TaxID=2724481 RepID=UPI001CCCA269|nr:type II secretion system protein [Clostridium sp. FP2]MBZ9624852.1 type II secretion system GspH family protein [Clostridium sp. FP2]
MFTRKLRGFTLIEVLITLAILGIILSAIATFFFTNYKTINKAQIEIEIQSEGDKVIEKISNTAIQCSEMKLTTSDNDDKIDSINDSIEFIDKEPNTLIVKETHTFTLDSSKKLLLNGVECGQFIEYIACTKIANGVQLEIKLRKDDVEKSISTTIYFRNAM